eukprot:NODE_11903_length_271_cov_36.208333.p2 GENE.NODE_11903_length_271_cov_36.208333~~NODE_11903_length_271_cov_36.208333.p2  ORF type:complete len:51 (+),score=11.41 NODE_11903_length_271_cov_36.208333:3-155(+)
MGHLTRMKGIMLSQAAQTSQLRNKVIAGAVTGALAGLQLVFHLIAKSEEA